MGINMNELFKNGDYVTLEDCKAFDEKFGLKEGVTMWAVARKMEGGEPIVTIELNENCIAKHHGDVDAFWVHDMTTKLSVEGVLYQSKDGLTLDELSKIHGAYEEGKRYKCVVGNSEFFTSGKIYTANGEGIRNDYSHSKSGCTARFKPVTKAEWVPSVGDEVMTSCGKATIRFIKCKSVCIEFESGSINVVQLSCLMPIDQERERIVNNAKSVGFGSGIDEYLNNLYDAGMLKEGDK